MTKWRQGNCFFYNVFDNWANKPPHFIQIENRLQQFHIWSVTFLKTTTLKGCAFLKKMLQQQMWQLKPLEKNSNPEYTAQLGPKIHNGNPSLTSLSLISRSSVRTQFGTRRGQRWGEKGQRSSLIWGGGGRGRKKKKRPPWPHFHLWSWSSVWREFSEELALEQREALCLLTTMFLIQSPISFLGEGWENGLKGMFSLISSDITGLWVI